jgi:hypothetical protein
VKTTRSRSGIIFLVALLVVLARPAFGQDRSTQNTKPPNLLELFPGLTDLADTTALIIAFEWTGLSPQSPTSANYPLELRNDRFEGEARFSVAGLSTTRSVTVPRDLVRLLLAAASRVKLWDDKYDAPAPVTDSYPFVGVTVRTKQGLLKIETRAHGKYVRYDPPKTEFYVERVPWAVKYLDRVFVVYASDLDQALDALEPYLRREEMFEELSK